MFRWLLAATLLSATACQSTLSTPSPQAAPQPTTHAATPALNWEETTSNGVTIGIVVPQGWSAYPSEHGLMLVEHNSSVAAGGALNGVVVNLFVPSLDSLRQQSSRIVQTNLAWVMLKGITDLPQEYDLSNAVTTEPVGLNWDGHDAAYYLVNDGSGKLTLVLAVALPPDNRIVVLNFSAPADQAPRIPWLLPNLLSTLEINGDTLSVEALETLPNPLPFPPYEPPKETSAAPPHYPR